MRESIQISQPELLLIHETKMEKEIFLHLSKKNWKKSGGLPVSSMGASGRIGMLWDAQKFELIESKHYTHWFFTKMLHKYSNI